VQEVQYDGSIKQLYMANGGDWGGTKVTALRNIGDSENPPTIRIILVPSTFSSSNIV
jgi:hypothetical protein